MASRPLIPILKTCECVGRSLPIRVDVFIASLIAQSTFEGMAIALTYRCRKCKAIVEVTVADIRTSYKGAAA